MKVITLFYRQEKPRIQSGAKVEEVLAGDTKEGQTRTAE